MADKAETLERKDKDVAENKKNEIGDISDVRNILELRRTAKETKRYKVLMRLLGLIVLILIMIIAAGYAISYFYNKFGSFTVRIDKYDMVQQGLTLSETPDFTITDSVLNAEIAYNMTNISGHDIPPNVDQINGSHNGENYIAYTFYLINAGDSTLSYSSQMNIESVTKNVDDAVRVAVYKNGQKTVYGKTKSNGGGKESDCDETFLASTIVIQKKNLNLKQRINIQS